MGGRDAEELGHQNMTMNPETASTGVPRAVAFAHLVALAETGRDEEVKAAVAALHPADAAELINLLERPEIQAASFASSRRTLPRRS